MDEIAFGASNADTSTVGGFQMKEVDCGKRHLTIVDAIEHAREHLGLIREAEHPRLGTKIRGPLANKDRKTGLNEAAAAADALRVAEPTA
jgi:hypothetical protein